MESFNSFLGAVISLLTIVSTVVGGLYVVHEKLQSAARVQKADIIKKIKEQDARLQAIEAGMLKSSDEWFTSLLKKVEKRVDTIDDTQLRRTQDIKVRLSEFEQSLANFSRDYGRIIDLDKERIDTAYLEKNLKAILDRQRLADDDIKLIKKVVTNQQRAIKNLSSNGKS